MTNIFGKGEVSNMTLAEYIAQERAKEPEYSKALELDAEISVIQERMKQDMIDLAAKVKELRNLKMKDYKVTVTDRIKRKNYVALVPFTADDVRINTNVVCLKRLRSSPEMYSRFDFNLLEVIL